MNERPFRTTFQGPSLDCVTAAFIVSGCSSDPGEPPNTIQIAEFNSALEWFGEGRRNFITLTAGPKPIINVQIYVVSETHAIALKAYCNIVKDALTDARFTDYNLAATMSLDAQS